MSFPPVSSCARSRHHSSGFPDWHNDSFNTDEYAVKYDAVEISSSLHQNITVGDIAGNVDALRYLEDNPAIISNPAALVNIDLWADTHAPNASTYYDRAVDLASSTRNNQTRLGAR